MPPQGPTARARRASEGALSEFITGRFCCHPFWSLFLQEGAPELFGPLAPEARDVSLCPKGCLRSWLPLGGSRSLTETLLSRCPPVAAVGEDEEERPAQKHVARVQQQMALLHVARLAAGHSGAQRGIIGAPVAKAATAATPHVAPRFEPEIIHAFRCAYTEMKCRHMGWFETSRTSSLCEFSSVRRFQLWN